MKGSFYCCKEGKRITALISLHNLSYSYTHTSSSTILSEVSLTAQAGEFVSVVGPSGCGKSTLFKIIAGLLEPSRGEVHIHGMPAAERLGRIAYMPQQDLLLPWRSVLENCLLPWEMKRQGSKADAIKNVRELLNRLGLAGIERAYPTELSGGMRGRVAFVRTLMTGGELLLLDEPFGALDALTKRELQRWLLELLDSLDKTVLLITHDLEEALLLSDRIYILPRHAEGRLQELSVGLPRPRHYPMIYDPPFMEMRQELERRLHAEISF